MEDRFRRILFAGAWLTVAGLIIAILLVVFGPLWDGGAPLLGPRQAFEAHLMALDNQDLESANSYVTPSCQIGSEDAEAGYEILRRGDSSFFRAFHVEGVWLHENGVEALLELQTPPKLMLPDVTPMVLVEGEWLVTCG